MEQREYTRRNPEKKKAGDKRYYETHQEQIKAYRHLRHVADAKKVSDAKYRIANREKLRQYFKELYAQKRDERIAAASAYASKNKEKIQEYAKKYRKRNKKAIDSVRQEWKKANIGRVKEYQSKNRALRRGIAGSYSWDQWVKLVVLHDEKCACCRKKKPLTVDHIIPLTWPGASNWITNIQPLCKSCNTSKNNHRDTDYRSDYVRAWALHEMEGVPA